MRRLLLAATLLAGAYVVPAHAELIQATPFFVDLGAQGFGNAPRMLTLQTSPLEVGGTQAGPGGTTVLTGDAVSGANKSQVYSAGALGWFDGSNVGIGFNTNNTGNSTGIAINSIALTLFNTAGVALDTFSLANPFSLTQAQLAAQQGNGNAVFEFILDAAEQAKFNADLLANGGASLVYAGLAASIGCSSGALSCEANDGADSFVSVAQPTATPLPATAGMFAGGVALIGLLVRRRKKKSTRSVIPA